MSSRNLRLTGTQPQQATAIYKALVRLKTAAGSKPLALLLEETKAFLKGSGFEVDYVAVVDAENLSFLDEVNSRKAVVVIAATLGGIRLIDNMLLN
jgi:pantoate--beta-alanine ligase